MTTYAIIGAVAVVCVALTMFAIWFSNYLGKQSGKSELRAEIADKETRRAQAAEQVLADPRTDSDTADRLRDNKF